MRCWSTRATAGTLRCQKGAKALEGDLLLANAKPCLDGPLLRGGRRERRVRNGVDRIAGDAWQSQHLCPLPRIAAGEGAADLSRRLRLLRHERPRGCSGRRRNPVAARSDARCACNGRARTSLDGIPRARRSSSTLPAPSMPAAASSIGKPRCGSRSRRKGLPNIPLLAPEAAGLDASARPQCRPDLAERRSALCGDSIQVIAHWLKDAPLRPAPIRSPGKPANCFAVESFIDELAVAARLGPRRVSSAWTQGPARHRGHQARGGSDAMAVAALAWRRPECGRRARDAGMAYVHYKHTETYVAMGMEVAVERASGQIKVERVVCAHDCGQIINPDGVRAQVEGNILQTLSRVLMEEVKFDRSRVTEHRLVELSDPDFLGGAQARHRADRPPD